MKKVIITVGIFLLALTSIAGSWNPYLNQGIISPAPLMPVQQNGTGTISMNIGNTGSDPVLLVAGQEMRLVITLSKGKPNHINPIAAIDGSWSQYFTWTYDPAVDTYTGIQNQAIPAGPAQGKITIQYLVTENSAAGPIFNGFRAELIPPAYISGINAREDDVVSSYTVTKFNTPYGIGEKNASQRIQVYSNENDIYVKDLLGNELKGKLNVYDLVGRLITTRKLYGGTLNKFSINVEQGYYVVEILSNDMNLREKIYLENISQ